MACCALQINIENECGIQNKKMYLVSLVTFVRLPLTYSGKENRKYICC